MKVGNRVTTLAMIFIGLALKLSGMRILVAVEAGHELQFINCFFAD
jgi:hypothetical protein